VIYSWDGWVPQDRLKKWSEENQELAKTLKKEMEAVTQQRNKSSANSKKRGDLSARDSEERTVAGRKRGRDYDTEKVRRLLSTAFFN
jgi:mortality factor 4-like protein 1